RSMTHIAAWTRRIIALLATSALAASCADTKTKDNEPGGENGTDATLAEAKRDCAAVDGGNMFAVERLVTDDPEKVPADFTDPLLKNAWGLAAGPDTPWEVANNKTAT